MLQGPEGDKMVEMALENPQNYVLKPQREGGGTHTQHTHTCVLCEEYNYIKLANFSNLF